MTTPGECGRSRLVPEDLPATRHAPRATRTPEAFEALAKDDARIVAAARLVADRHRLAGVPIARFAGGSLPVFALGPSRVLKFYPPCFPEEAEVELGVLQALEGNSRRLRRLALTPMEGSMAGVGS